MTAPTYTAFFYGTLMHPKILKAVIKNDGSHLQLCPAVLLEFTRHQVKGADYPGLLPVSRGRALFNRDLTREECCVRGTVVKGLTTQDVELLDIFEGSEYTRESVRVHPLGSFKDVSTYTIDDALVPSQPSSSSERPPAVDAETYIYVKAFNLKSELWSFDDFVKNNAWKWYTGIR